MSQSLTIDPNSENISEPLGITSLMLTNFRSYESMKFVTDQRPVVLTGLNGAGKTNLLEALSFLSPGRGLRGAKLSNALRFNQGLRSNSWFLNAKLGEGLDELSIGTGYEVNPSARSEKRVIKINDTICKAQSELSEVLSIVWLTPQMDDLFTASSGERRKFLDRLISTFDVEHSSRVYRYEHALRERSRLLKQGITDPHWYMALEATMATSGTAIAYARQEAITQLSSASAWALGVFPQAELRLDGVMDAWIDSDLSALEVEEKLKESLANSRRYDAEAGSAKDGPHRTDMLAMYKEKQMPAAFCSTGEQKALLISLIMAAIRVQITHRIGVPILLLDEVVAHLDEGRRETLFQEIINLKMQVWMTGTDINVFAGLKDAAQYFKVDSTQINPQICA